MKFLNRTFSALLRAAIGLTLALSFCMCTVKEDRRFCPSWLHFSSVVFPEGEWDTMHFFAYRNGVQELSETFDYETYISKGVDLTIIPGTVHVAAVFGWPEEWIDGDLLTIPQGQMCPEAWGFDERIIVEEDKDLEFVEPLRMLYANVYIDVVGRGEDYPWYFVMEGDVDGYKLATLEPHLGNFAVSPSEIDIQHLYCRVPRQVDESLGLSLYEIPKDSPETKAYETGDRKQYTLPVGEIAAEGGYDWTAQVLDDIYVTLDYAASKITITINGWTKVVMLNGQYKI